MYHFKTLLLCLLIGVTCQVDLDAQFQPVGSQTDMYFPQLADGGGPSQQWLTALSFVNPNVDAAAVLVYFYGDDGSALPVDFGSGPITQLSLTIPARGSSFYRSTGASPTIRTGWAIAFASLPLQATLAFRDIVNGVTQVEINAEPTLPSFKYFSPATRYTGIALANSNPYTVSVKLGVTDPQGNLLGVQTLAVAPGNHTSFNLWQQFPNIATDFRGSLTLVGANPPGDSFLAWTLNADAGGVISSLPPGRLEWPISHTDQIQLVFLKIWDAAQRSGYNFGSGIPALQTSPTQVINAFASGGSAIQINLALSQLISDSPGELAFAVGHEMGHIYQQRNGGTQLFNTDIEFDADVWGAFLALLAGYDPYSGAGTLAKLAMATGTAGLTNQFEAQLAPDAHKSFNTRLDNIFTTLQVACASSPAAQSLCAEYRNIIHPNFPSTAPLLQTPGTAKR